MHDDNEYIPINEMIHDGMGAIAWLIVAIFITVVSGLIAWGIHAAITGAGSMPAYCATLECAVAGGL